MGIILLATKMPNPHFPQNENANNQQFFNPHNPTSNVHATSAPQAQANPTMPFGQRRTSSNSNNYKPPMNSKPPMNYKPPMNVYTDMISGKVIEKSPEPTFAEMDRSGVLPECLYCDQKFHNAGKIRVHLRSHSKIRPFKCALCNYSNWYKQPLLHSHFVTVHGRKGLSTDVHTNVDEENELVAKIEEEAKEVREIQKYVYQGNPEPDKRVPDREAGLRDLRKYDGPQPSSTPENNDVNKNTTQRIPLSAKLVQHIQQAPSRVQYDPANVPSDLQQLPLDKLLN